MSTDVVAPDPCFDRVVLALAGLARPNRVEDRMAALAAFVEWWHGPITCDDAVPEPLLAGLSLPRPLAWWYRHAGGRAAIMSGQNVLFHPGESRYPFRRLRVEDGRLMFQIENQGCFDWSTLPEGDDPPVFGRWSDNEPWRQEAVTLAEHLVLNAIHEAALCHAPFAATTCELTDDALARLAERMPALPIGPWLWCEMRAHAGGGAVLSVSPLGERSGGPVHCAWLAAKRGEAFAALRPLLDDGWEIIRG